MSPSVVAPHERAPLPRKPSYPLLPLALLRYKDALSVAHLPPGEVVPSAGWKRGVARSSWEHPSGGPEPTVGSGGSSPATVVASSSPHICLFAAGRPASTHPPLLPPPPCPPPCSPPPSLRHHPLRLRHHRSRLLLHQHPSHRHRRRRLPPRAARRARAAARRLRAGRCFAGIAVHLACAPGWLRQASGARTAAHLLL